MMRFVTLEEARAARGLRLVVMANGPSPWTEAAKGCFDVKGLDYLAVRQAPADAETRAWTGQHNAPVALFDDEPPRAGWAEILALAERLAPRPSLIPHDAAERIQMFGLAHEIMGEGGLVWSLRLQQIHVGLTTNGARGFSMPAARYLGAKYGYAPERVAVARARLGQGLVALGGRLVAGHRYLIGDELSALDIYAAAAMGVFAPLPDEQCAMAPVFRSAFSTIDDDIRATIPPSLLAHRDFIYAHHLVLPVRL